MMSGVPFETCCAFKKLWNNKFCYKLYLVGISTESSTMHGSMSIRLSYIFAVCVLFTHFSFTLSAPLSIFVS